MNSRAKNWRRGGKPAEEAEPESTDNGELRTNADEEPWKDAEKAREVRAEVVTAGKRPRREKSASKRVGRGSQVRRKSSGRVELPAIFILKIFGQSQAKTD